LVYRIIYAHNLIAAALNITIETRAVPPHLYALCSSIRYNKTGTMEILTQVIGVTVTETDLDSHIGLFV
jgi:hypothetical protein